MIQMLIDAVVLIWSLIQDYTGQLVGVCSQQLCVWAVDAVDRLLGICPDAWADFMGTNIITPYVDYVHPFTYWFPVWECLGIFMIATGIVATVWLVRWCIALVPGISVAGFSIGPFGGG